MLFGLCGYWCLLLHFCWPNHGGMGSYLPYNLVAWLSATVLCTSFWLVRPGNARIAVGTNGMLLIAGAVLMTLPLIWSPTAETRYYALPRIAGLWGGVAFWITLKQCHFSRSQKFMLLYALALAGIVESIVVLVELHGSSSWLPKIWQLIIDKYGRSGVGVFQQVNVTDSFLAQSLAISLLLLGLRQTRLSDRRAEKLRISGLSIGIVLLSVVLTETFARIGWLGGIVAITGIYCLLCRSVFHQKGHHRRLLILAPLIGIVIGLGLNQLSIAQQLAHTESNHQRLLTLYYTFIYALNHPLSGYGAGTYEGYYQAFLASLNGGNPGKEMMTHPHNELLYQYAEGGVAAVAGVFVWGTIYLRLWWKNKTAFGGGVLIAMLPVLLHTQVEFPLYYSTPHWLALLLLLSMAEQVSSARCSTGKHHYHFVGKWVMFSLALFGAIVSLQGFTTGNILDKFEHSELEVPEIITTLSPPFIFQLRYDQDLTSLRLIRNNTSPDRSSLRAFTEENARWLSVKAEPEMFSNQIDVLKYLHSPVLATYWEDRAKRTLPWEKEFQ